MALVEHILIDRARGQGIVEVALGDAHLPVEGAMRPDMLLPVLVDYANQVILRHTELRFDSALAEELTSSLAVDQALGENRLPLAEDLRDADQQAAPLFEQSLLRNITDENAGLKRRTEAQTAATMPVSVNLLILDTALESSIHLSRTHQQATLGQTEASVLDLTPTYDLLAQLNLPVPVIPTSLHERLASILAAEDETSQELAPPADEHEATHVNDSDRPEN